MDVSVSSTNDYILGTDIGTIQREERKENKVFTYRTYNGRVVRYTAEVTIKTITLTLDSKKINTNAIKKVKFVYYDTTYDGTMIYYRAEDQNEYYVGAGGNDSNEARESSWGNGKRRWR